MEAMSVVEHLHVLDDGLACLVPCGPRAAVDQFDRQRGKEALYIKRTARHLQHAAQHRHRVVGLLRRKDV
jgi:hypothetical protein